MSDEAALRAAIVAAPDDDAPRLVLADVLTSRGDPHGELIVLQCQLAKMPDDDPAAAPMRERVKKMLAAGWKAYAGELAPYASAESFDRGFVREVRMTIAAFAKHGPRLFATYPIHTLNVANDRWTAADLEKLARTPVPLRGLQLAQRTHGVDGLAVAALAKSPHFGQLEELELYGCGATAADWKALFEKLQAPRLHTLSLSSVKLAASAIEGIAKNRALRALRDLSVSVRETIGKKGVGKRLEDAYRVLAQAVALERLSLNDELVADGAVAAFFDADAAAALRRLRLESCDTTNALWKTIAKSPKAATLGEVEIDGYQDIPVDGIAALLASKHATALRRISVESYGASMDKIAELERVLLAVPTSHPLSRVTIPGHREGPSVALRERFRVD